MAIGTVLIDTNAYAAFKKGISEAVEIIRRVQLICINSIVLGELHAGFTGGNKKRKNEEALDFFPKSKRVKVLPITAEISKMYAMVFQQQKKKGRPIPTNDLWIAATAFQHGISVFTFDAHFREIDDLSTVRHLDDLF